MKNSLKNILVWLILFLFLSLSVNAQKSFFVTVEFPKTLDVSKVEAYLDNGKRNTRIAAIKIENNKVIFKGDFYSIYAILNLQYKIRTDKGDQIYGDLFFLNDQPGSIIFHKIEFKKSQRAKYSLKNVLDFKSHKEKMFNIDSSERRVMIDYYRKHENEIISGKNPEIQSYYFNVLRKKQAIKKLEYIKVHPDSYYSFYTFRSDIAWPLIFPADSLIYLLNSIFPQAYRFSDESNYLIDYIYSRSTNQEAVKYPLDFTSQDINGGVVKLSNFRNNKNVLLHFWATWCSPCMKELPLIREIHSRYGGDSLQIISIALESTDGRDISDIVGDNKMEWINIYNDVDLTYKYGNFPVPRLMLIDKSGELVYDSFSLKKKEDSTLSQLNIKISNLYKSYR